MDIIQPLWLNQYTQACLVMMSAVLIESLWKWPEKYHPLTFFRLLALRMQHRVNRPGDTAAKQRRIAGLLGFMVIIPPFFVIMYIALSAVYFRVGFDLLLLVIAISFRPVMYVVKHVHHRLGKEQKLLARETVQLIVLRETSLLSPMGCAKAALESASLRFFYQFATPLFFFFFVGPVTALLVRVIYEFAHEWHISKPTNRHFGQPLNLINRAIQWIPCSFHLLLMSLLFRPWKTCIFYVRAIAFHTRDRIIGFTALAIDGELGGPAIYAGSKYRYNRFHRDVPLKLGHMQRAVYFITSAKIAISISYALISLMLFYLGIGNG